jgi:phosphomannomutase
LKATETKTMILMTGLLEQWKKAGKINGKQFVGSTIVSTPMMMELATNYNVECKVGFTGFKWIAKMIEDFELEFIGRRRKFRFMVGDAVRDKDAVAHIINL